MATPRTRRVCIHIAHGYVNGHLGWPDLEFKSPVASSFLTCFDSNWTATGLSNITLCADRTETCGNRLPSVAMAVTTGRDQFFTRLILMLTMLHVL